MTQADKKVRKVTAFFLALSVCSNLVVEVHFFITEKLSVKPAILMENADCAITTITAHTHTHTLSIADSCVCYKCGCSNSSVNKTASVFISTLALKGFLLVV